MATDPRFQQPIKANVNDAIVSGDTTDNTEQGAGGESESNASTSNVSEEDANGDSDEQPEAAESEKTESETKE